METARWHLRTKIAFRFAFLYFSLYTLYVPMQFLPFFPFQQLFNRYNALWQKLVPWFGTYILHTAHDFVAVVPNPAGGSQDTTFVYVEAFCYLVVAAAGTVVWSVLDRERANYAELHSWTIVYLRLVLAITMINFGAVKVFPAQFPEPALSKLLERFGNSSPMGLLWIFMGASQTYTFFAGAVELLGGVLLVVPQLATLGALITIGAVGNVLMLNLGYDVPVKLGAIHLLLMAGFIVAPDCARLANILVLNRSAEAAVVRPLFRRKWLNVTAITLQIVFGLLFVGFKLYRSERRAVQVAESRKSAPLYGIWAVDEFTAGGNVQESIVTSQQSWRRIVVDSVADGMIETLGGPDLELLLHFDPSRNAFNMTRGDDPGWIAEFTYEKPQPNFLILTGKMGGRPIHATLHKEDASRFLLMTRGFRWIQESALIR